MTTTVPAGVFHRAHRRTTTGLLMLVTSIAFEAMAVGAAMPTAVTGAATGLLSMSAAVLLSVAAFVVLAPVGVCVAGRAAAPPPAGVAPAASTLAAP